MIKILKVLILISILSFSAKFFAQTTIRTLPFNGDILTDSVFFDETSTRKVYLLNKNWEVYNEDSPNGKIKTIMPVSFEGDETMVFETYYTFTKDQIRSKSIRLGFLGMNYTSEVLVNNLSIYKRASGEIPFDIELPKDILKPDAPNKITIKVNSKLNSDYTIPVLQRFLFPSNQQGIIRDVFLKLLPLSNISSAAVNTFIEKNLSSARVNISLSLDNLNALKDSLDSSENLILKIRLKPQNSQSTEFKYETTITELYRDKLNTSVQFEIQNPVLWSPDSPNFYLCEIGFYKGSKLIDVTKKGITFFNVDISDQSLALNNKPFTLNGTTYFLNETELSKNNAYSKIQSDLRLIKNIGFNAVRFSKAYPNPYALKICREIGLLALVELPLNSVPEEILSEADFRVHIILKINELKTGYRNYSDAFILGAGSSYLPNSPITENFLSEILKSVSDIGITTYASFYGIQENDLDNLNLYGIELFTRKSDDTREFLSKVKGPKYFLSEVNYPNYIGSANGYLVQNSTEAQAKFYDNTIDIAVEKKLSGFFINTLFNYRGDYKSLYAGYSEKNYYYLGATDKNASINSLSYKVLHSKFNLEDKVTIPIGTKKDENKLMFILFALILSLIMAVIINTKKKFREDCTRALFKPYNFFSDIRDNRIISSTHTFVLLLVEVGSASLLLTILLFYLRTNILLEKILLAFGNPYIIDTISELAWHPEKCFLILFGILFIKIGLLSIIIKLASFSLKIRVEFTGIFYTVVWAFLPFTLLLPAELILYKILALYGMNIYSVIFLVIFILWILQRVLRGIHVIFDIQPFPVYLYSILLILIVTGGVILYYQLTNSTLYYITNAISQYESMPF